MATACIPGVNFWSQLRLDPSKNECGNSSQSPIHIQVRSTICAYIPMSYINYRKPLLSPSIVNNGHTVQVSAPLDRYHGVGLSHPASRFRFLQLHFHWGNSSARGSEHVVDDNHYCMEMHLVHVNTRYETVEEASKHHDGIAVVAVLFEMDVFRRVHARGHDNGTTHDLVDNYRPPMPLNGRYVLRNFLCPPLQKGQTKVHAPARTPDSVEGQE
ncbi:carbonic anhydrase 15-like [Ixodes scapularis]|uniref:carbonic anhydrase 15-like n=1 Tax=Ixodes scapularis TaxID=6945 RepID=UPI001C391750|nr:carbonic anhydrase 15-like [Ixodes scapularis]